MILLSLIQRLNDYINSSMKEIKKIFFLMERVSWTHQKKNTKSLKKHHSFFFFYFCFFLRLTKIKSKLDIVWFDQKIPYDLAFWIHTDSLEPKYEKRGCCVNRLKPIYDQGRAIYAIDLMGKRWSNMVFREANGIRLVSLNENIVINHSTRWGTQGWLEKWIVALCPLDLEEIKWLN